MSRRNLARPEHWRAWAIVLLVAGAGLGTGVGALAAGSAHNGTPPDPLESVKAAIRLKQFSAAAAQLQSFAQAGNPQAQYLLGVFYLNGLNGPPEPNLAQSWLRKSSAQGYARASATLASLGHPAGDRPIAGASRPLNFPDPAVRKEALWLAASRGDLPAAKALADRDSVNSSDDFGRGALARAAESGHTDVVQWLLQCGAAVDAVDRYGTTALMLAANGGHAESVAALLRAGAHASPADHAGNTALMRAAARGNLPTVEHLLSADSNINAHDIQGWSALDFAQNGGDAAVVRKLIENGAAGTRQTHTPRASDSLMRATAPVRDLYSGWSDLAVAASRTSPALLESLPRQTAGSRSAPAGGVDPILVRPDPT